MMAVAAAVVVAAAVTLINGFPHDMKGEAPMIRFAIVPLVLMLLIPFPALAAETVGTVIRLSGQAEGRLGAQRRAIRPQAPVYRAESLHTAAASRLRARLGDGTQLTMGANATLVLDDLVLGRRGAQGTVRLMSGALRLVSGAHHPDLQVQTPVGTIGIRGTDFWLGPVPAGLGVLLLQGAVEVRTNAGRRVLSRPGDAVVLTRADAPPGPVTRWTRRQQRRALATTAFPDETGQRPAPLTFEPVPEGNRPTGPTFEPAPGHPQGGFLGNQLPQWLKAIEPGEYTPPDDGGDRDGNSGGGSSGGGGGGHH